MKFPFRRKKTIHPSWFSDGREFEGERDYLRSIKRNLPLISTMIVTSCSAGGLYYYGDKIPKINLNPVSIYSDFNKGNEPSKKEPKQKKNKSNEITSEKQEMSPLEILAEENAKKFNTDKKEEKSTNLQLVQIKPTPSEKLSTLSEQTSITSKTEIKEVKPTDYDNLLAFYKENKRFVEEIKPLYQVIYQGKLDFIGNLELQDFIVYSNGSTEVKLKNGIVRKLSSNETYEFFIASVLNAQEIKKYFTTSEGQILYRDLVTESHVLELEKKYPGYINSLVLLGKKTKVYTEETRVVFEPSIKRLEQILK